jgi:hypothetical protein
MKKLILAASLIAPLAVAAPAFAEVDASPTAVLVSSKSVAAHHAREFTARHNADQGRPAGVTPAEQSQIDRQGEPGSTF